MNLTEIVAHWSKIAPDQVALVQDDRTRTWAEVDRRSDAVATALRASGVVASDRVVIVDKNSIEYFEILFGAAKLGVVPVPVNWRLGIEEVTAIVRDSGAKVVFASAGIDGALLDALKVQPGRLVCVGSQQEAGDEYEHWTEAGTEWADAVTAHEGSPNDVVLQLYTSGTTGVPKGVMLTDANFAALPAFCRELDLEPSSVALLAMPLFHVGGIGWALAALAGGGRVVVVRDVVPHDLDQILRLHRITHTFFVPLIMRWLVGVASEGGGGYRHLRRCAYGGAPIDVALLHAAREVFGDGLTQLYGMTETTGAITILRPEDHAPGMPERRLASCGRPFPHVELEIRDPEDGTACRNGEPGEVLTRSSQNMLGYHHKERETSSAFTTDGWLRTGDIGWRDHDGYVYLVDRAKDMIITGGENVYPAEVERVLLMHPAIADAAVIGIPSERWGETIHACIVARVGHVVTAAEVMAFVRERLAHFKAPTSVEFLDELPRNASGKVLRQQLRARFWANSTRRVG